MSQRRTRGNPNLRRTANVPPLIVSNSNEGAPPLAIGTPNSTTTAIPIPASSTPVIAMPANPTLAAILGSSNLVLDLTNTPVLEDFGRDKDLKNLLKNFQPKAFTGEGTYVPKICEEWIMSMDDCFALDGFNALAQGIMGKDKLEGLV